MQNIKLSWYSFSNISLVIDLPVFLYFQEKYAQHLVCLINTTSLNKHRMPFINKVHEKTKP